NSKKDASIVDLIDSFRLEGPLAEIPRAEELQPSPEQLMLPIHRVEDNVILGETFVSFSLQIVHSRVQRVRGEIMEKISDPKPHDKDPSAATFKEKELDTISESALVS
nr:hypothetical protein [Tanacetum cinerariifolium]